MPNYSFLEPDGKGGLKEVEPKDVAESMGLQEYDVHLMLKTANTVKLICTIVGWIEEPRLVWNENMPDSLVVFVTNYVADKLKSNPGWELTTFDFGILYDGNKLKLKFELEDK